MTGVNDVDNVGQVLTQTLLFGFYYFWILILWILILDRCVILMHQVVSFDGKTELDFWESEECNRWKYCNHLILKILWKYCNHPILKIFWKNCNHPVLKKYCNRPILKILQPQPPNFATFLSHSQLSTSNHIQHLTAVSLTSNVSAPIPQYRHSNEI